MLVVSLIVAIASQVSIGLISSDFIVSAGAIFFAVFLFHYEEIKIVPTGILSGIMVYILRVITHYLIKGNIEGALISYTLEILFYIFYSIIYSLLRRSEHDSDLTFLLLVMMISDLGANIVEVLARSLITTLPSTKEIGATLFLVSIVRSTIVWLVLNSFKYYKMLLIKEEHEIRYKKLLLFTSQLKTEMYWIEKNMDQIEEVMSQSYKLFEKINLNKDKGQWPDISLNIARSIHEIKKEYGLVIRGMKKITESELKDKGMNFKDIISLLSETMKREAKILGKDIEFEFNLESNFYTSKHYYIMSILRNLIMNSMDAISTLQKGAKIKVAHVSNKDEHTFTVWDNGSGIEEESLKHIFSPGFSTKINYDTGEINRGLGLSIVMYIAKEQLGGKVDVDSKVGGGTNFSISIPRIMLED